MDVQFAALLLLAGCGSLDGYTYPSYDLTLYCGRTIELPCGSRNTYGRAGTFKYDIYLASGSSCIVNITMGAASSSCSSTALYFNIKKQKMPLSGRFIVSERILSYGESWTEKKNIYGHGYAFSNPTSVAQFRSAFDYNPHISLIFETTSSLSSGYFSLTLDYSVIFEYSSSEDSYCNALSGYVLDELICETGDRVNCPTSYYDSTGDTNAALSTNQGTQSSCGLATGAVAGIVVGVLVGAVIFSAIIVLICRRQRNTYMHRHVAGVTVPVSNQYTYSTPTVVTTGYPAPYPAQPQYAGPPPAYPAPYPGHPAAGPGYPNTAPSVGGQPQPQQQQ